MSNFKRVLSFMLTLIMLVGMVPSLGINISAATYDAVPGWPGDDLERLVSFTIKLEGGAFYYTDFEENYGQADEDIDRRVKIPRERLLIPEGYTGDIEVRLYQDNNGDHYENYWQYMADILIDGESVLTDDGPDIKASAALITIYNSLYKDGYDLRAMNFAADHATWQSYITDETFMTPFNNDILMSSENWELPCVWEENTGKTVTLHAGPEGNGKSITTTLSENNEIIMAENAIKAIYGFYPEGGASDQRIFIGWYSGYDSRSHQGIGTQYEWIYTGEDGGNLYAIWGYPIMFDADGGLYSDNTSKYLAYVGDYGTWNANTDLMDQASCYKYILPEVNGDIPAKEGARRVSNSDGYAYGLIRSDGKTFYTWEGMTQNLTFPPTGGVMAWSDFRCTDTDDAENPYGIEFPEFVAIWEPSVTYNANTGVGEDIDGGYLTWAGDKLYNYEDYAVKANTFTKDGATFIGWNTKADGTGTYYAPGDKINQLTSSDPITLYAQWSDGGFSGVGEYKITFNPAGGNFTNDGSGNPRIYTATNDGTAYGAICGGDGYYTKDGDIEDTTLYPTTLEVTRDGYFFNGWMVDDIDNVNSDYFYDESDPFLIPHDITFTARWITDNNVTRINNSGSYTLTFNPNGGEVVSAYSNCKINNGTEYAKRFQDAKYPQAIKIGYDFDGWDYQGLFTLYDGNTGDYYALTSNASFKAQWNEIAHDCVYYEYSNTPATCTVDGLSMQACVCGATKSVTLTKDHNYNEVWEEILPTCEEAGSITYICSECYDSYNTVEGDPATGHAWDAGILVPASCTCEETILYTCQNDSSHTYTEVSANPALGHDLGDPYDMGNGYTKVECNRENCDYNGVVPNRYNIVYDLVLPTATHGTDAPMYHTYATDTVLVDATAVNATFAGWYLDREYTQPITSIGAYDILAPIKVYAKWTLAIKLDGVANAAHLYTGDVYDSANSLGAGVDATITMVYGEDTKIPYRWWHNTVTFTGWTNAAIETLGQLGTIPGYAFTANATLTATYATAAFPVIYIDGVTGEVYDENSTNITNPDKLTKSLTYVNSTSDYDPVEPTRDGYKATLHKLPDMSDTAVGKFDQKTITWTNYPEGKIVYYVKWTPNTCVLTLNSMKGTSTPAALGTGTAGTANRTITVTYDQPFKIEDYYTYSYEGYNFLGWDTAAAGTTVVYGPDYVFDNNEITTATTLYAVWAPIEVTITVDPNGGQLYAPDGSTPGSDKNGSFTHTYGTDSVISDYYPEIFRNTHTFTGWLLSTDSSVITDGVLRGDAVKKNANTATLTAQWVANTFPVTYIDGVTGEVYDENSTNITNPDLLTQSLTYVNSTSDYNPVEPTRDGYTATLHKLSDMSDTAVGKFDQKTITWTNYPEGEIVYYVKWTPITVALTLHDMGGTATILSTGKTSIDNQKITITYDSPYKVEDYYTYAYTGYTLLGWDTASTGYNVVYPVGHQFKGNEFLAATTLYAVWAYSEVTVTLDPNAGTLYAPDGTSQGSDTAKKITHTYGTATTISDYYTVKRTGYTFSGWKITVPENYNLTITNGVIGAEQLKDNSKAFTLVAQWTVNTFPIEYYVDGVLLTEEMATEWGITNYANIIAKHTHTYGTATSNLVAPTRTGYTMSTWSYEPGGTAISGQDIAANAFSYEANGEGYVIKVYATSTAKTYSHRMYPNGGTFTLTAGGTATDYKAFTTTYNEEGDLTTLFTALDRTGYTFVGWNTVKDGTGDYVSYDMFTLPANSISAADYFYAIWEPDTFPIEYYVDGILLTEESAKELGIVNYEAILAKSTHTYGTATADLVRVQRTGYTSTANWSYDPSGDPIISGHDIPKAYCSYEANGKDYVIKVYSVTTPDDVRVVFRTPDGDSVGASNLNTYFGIENAWPMLDYGDTYILPENYREGYHLAGFYSDTACTNRITYVKPSEFITTYNQGTTYTDYNVYVKWEALETTPPTGTIDLGVDAAGISSEFIEIEEIRYGIYSNNYDNIVITGEDATNYVDPTVEYYLSPVALTQAKVEALDASVWVDAPNGEAISLDGTPDGEYIMYVKITDDQGNVAYISSQRFVYDTTPPLITGIEDGKEYCDNVTLTLEEKYLDKFTINGAAVTVVGGTYDLLGTENGTTYAIYAKDKAGNVTEVTVVVYNGHTYEGSVSKEPTCTEMGETTYVCTRCGDTYTATDIPANGHTEADAVEENRVEATCTVDGSYDMVVYCSVCGEKLSTEHFTIPASGHTLTNVAAKAPTCEEIGWDAYEECSVCDYTTYNELAALGHDWDDGVITAPSCTEDGYTTYTCQNDNSHVNIVPIDKLGHSEKAPVEENRVEATCTADGSYDMVVYCSVCGEKLSTEHFTIPASGHTEADAVEENRVDASCTVDGGYDMVVYCSVCGEKLSTEHFTLTAPGHTWGEWYQSKAPTYSEDGENRRDCDVCDAYETEVVPRLVDTTPADVDVTEDEEKNITDGTPDFDKDGVTVTITATDEESSIDEITYSIEKDGVVIASGNYDPENKPVLSEEGEYTVTVKVTNGEGLPTVVITDTITVDKTKPVLTPSDDESYEDITVKVEEENIENVVITDEDNNNVEVKYDENGDIVLPKNEEDGDKTYTVTVTDKAGNEASVTVTVKDDDNKPTVDVETSTNDDITDGNDDYVSEEEIEITIDAKDEETGIVDTKYTITDDKGNVTEGTYDPENKPVISGEGEYNITIEVTDGDGNITEVITDKVIIDNTLPVINGIENGKEYCGVENVTFTVTEKYLASVTVNGEAVTEYVLAGNVGDAYTVIVTDLAGNTVTYTVTVYAEHAWNEGVETKAPTCTEEGEMTYTCTRCGETRTEEIAAKGHDYESVVTAPTCTEQGYTTYTCHCGDTYKDDYVAALGHTPGEAVIENNAAPTCTETGSYDTVVYCSVCGEELSRETIEVEALGHTWGEWTVVTEASCEGEGLEKRECSVCDAEETRVIEANGHTLTQVEAKAPTCEEIGWNAYEECSVCDYTTYVELPATGHDYEGVVTAPTCTEQGYTTYTCKNDATHTYVADNVDATGHTPAAAVEENRVDAECGIEGSYDMAVYCSVCGEELSRESFTIDALTHEYAFEVNAGDDNGYVQCIYCDKGYDGFFLDEETGNYYYATADEKGLTKEGLFVVDGYYYYGLTDKEYGNLICDDVYMITYAEKTEFNAENADHALNGRNSCYAFGADYRIIPDGFVSGQMYRDTIENDPYAERTFYYENYQLVLGLRLFDEEDTIVYRYFNDWHGFMYVDTRLWISDFENAEAGTSGHNPYGLPHGYYNFDSEGIMQFPEGYIIVNHAGYNYLTLDGVKQSQGLYEIETGKYVYVKYGKTVAQNEYTWLTSAHKNGLIGGPNCFYYFGEDFTMEVERFVEVGGKTYYINEKAEALLGFNKVGEDYYFFNARTGLMYTDSVLWVGENEYGVEEGNHYFMEDGKMFIDSGDIKPILTEENGKIYITIDGVKQYYGLYEIDGELYYAQGDGVIAADATVWVSNTNDLVENKGYYYFDADGKMMRTGFMTTGKGYTYYYDNGVLAKGLTKIGDAYYFFNVSSGSMYADTTLWIGGDNAYGFAAGYYYFDAEGKLFIADEEAGVKKVIYENGYYYFTIDGIKQYAGIYELDGDYYYAMTDGKLYANTTLYLSDAVASEFGGAAGNYGFDGEGKLIQTGFITTSTGYTYYYDNLVLAKGLTKIGEDIYFFNASSGAMYTETKMWIGASNVLSLPYGYYYFGADGKCTGKV